MNGASPPSPKRLSESSVERRPAWSKFNFDDGFDLNTASGSRDPLPFSSSASAASKSPKVRDVPLSAHARRTSVGSAGSFKELTQATNSISEVAKPPRKEPTNAAQDIAPAAPKSSSNGTSAVPALRAEATPHVNVSRASPQANRAQTVGVPNWERPVAPVHRPFSSADAYTQPIEQLQSEASSRPGTALSHLSGSHWLPEGAARSTGKRASVLSFETAISGGFVSGDDARTLDHDDNFQDSHDMQPWPPAASAPQPWLDSYSTSSGSLSGDRTIPGALPGSFWAESSEQPSTSASSSRILPPARTKTVTPPASTVLEPLPSTRGQQLADLPPIKTKEPFLAPQTTEPLTLSPNTIRAPSEQADSMLTPHPLITKAQPALPELGTESRRLDPISASSLSPNTDSPVPPLPPKSLDVATPSVPLPNNMPPTSVAPSFAPPNLFVNKFAPQPLPPQTNNFANVVEPQAMLRDYADQKPVSDLRKKPLADISPAQKAAGLAHLQAQVEKAVEQPRDLGAAAPDAPVKTEAPLLAVLERGRRKSNASLLTSAVLAQPRPITPDEANVNGSDTHSLDAPSREASPPPDGEVEARAEWERRQMKRKQKRESLLDGKKGKADALKNQLKPLQLVPAENVTNLTDRRGLQVSSGSNNSRLSPSGPGLNGPEADAPSTSVTTQQLQKIQAREQRRSVGAFSAAMAAANVTSSGSNGPYPVFASPASGAQKAGVRQYPGLMAQRSLVAPFELQHRPDGLPSGLIGPDGVRKSLNDPEVCLECMMRDEDMIDIRVLGPGIWERESDKDFEEAVRLENEEELAKANGEHIGRDGSNGSTRESRSSRRSHKKIGKGDPLSVDRLKLHTQMNPPASSFRWRTLQAFLAVQAKYIAMEQQRLRADAEKQRLGAGPVPISRNISAESGLLMDTDSAMSAPVPPARDASSIAQRRLPTNTAPAINDLAGAQNNASVQAARNRLTQSSSAGVLPQSILKNAGTQLPPLQTKLPQSPEDDFIPANNALPSVPPLSVSNSRRIPTQAARTASIQDLRAAAESRTSSAAYPSSPSESLLPPSRSFNATSPSTPARYGNRSGTSQLSFMHSGSMVDMHVAQEDRVEHRLNQNGFVPGTPLAVESPGTMQRSYYGFPGDGDSSPQDATIAERSRMVSGDGYVNPQEARPPILDADRDDGVKQKKKGLRGLFSKFTSKDTSQGQDMDVNGSIASRNPSKRSEASISPQRRQNSLSADRSMDLVPPPNMTTLEGALTKAGKSSSSLFSPKNDGETEADGRSRSQVPELSLFQHPPGMTSQSSLDLGPFQSGSPSTFETTRARKPTSPLVQKYLNSPSPQTQAPAPYQSNTRGGADTRRISSFASNKDLRQTSLQPIADLAREPASDLQSPPQTPLDKARDERSASQLKNRPSQSTLRKELPPMPPGLERPNGQQNDAQRYSMAESMSSMHLSPNSSANAASGRVMPLDIRDRRSMQLPSRSQTGFTNLPLSGSQVSVNLPEDPSGAANSGPRRPPRNPRRPDGLNSPSLVNLDESRNTQDFPRPAYAGPSPVPAKGADDSSERSKMSRFLRLPFGRKKRDSAMAEPKPSAAEDSFGDDRGSSGFMPRLKGRKSFSGLGLSRPSMQAERPRVVSSPANEGQPPRSQSAFGISSRLQFMDGRRSMNVPRSGRLSAMEDEEELEEDDLDDEMEVEPGFEAEFNRFDQEAKADRSFGSSARGRDVSGGAASFGRKSLNLLRDGFRMPMRQPSGDVRAKREF